MDPAIDSAIGGGSDVGYTRKIYALQDGRKDWTLKFAKEFEMDRFLKKNRAFYPTNNYFFFHFR